MTISWLKQELILAKKEHPELSDKINDIYQIVLDEMDEGYSTAKVVDDAYSALQDLISKDN